MKIVIDYRLAASSHRGMARYCREMTNEILDMLPEGWGVVLYVDRNANLDELPSVDRRIVPTKNYISGEQIWIPYYLRKDHANVYWAPANTFPLCKVKGVRYIATIHDLIFFEKPEGRQTVVQKIGMYYRRFVISAGIKKLDGCCTVSEYSKGLIEKRFGIKNVLVTPNCIGQFLKKVNELKERNHYDRKDFYFTVSGDAYSKNFQFLVEWFMDHPECKLEAAGFSPYSTYRNTIPNNITILPANMSDEELIEKYSTCRTFLFVSLNEGFGIPILEAMACGCKMILSNRASIPEIGGDMALYINPLSLSELTDKMKQADGLDSDTNYQDSLSKYENWRTPANKLMRIL